MLGDVEDECYFENDSGELFCRHCGVNQNKDHATLCIVPKVEAFIKEVKGSENTVAKSKR